MKKKQTNLTLRIWTTALILAIFALVHTPAISATVEWQALSTLELASPPLDISVSKDDGKIYILTEKGDVQIFLSNGRLMDTVHVGSHVDQILAGPRENILIVKSRSKKTVEILALDFIRDIDIKGSPFMGNEDAPVTIVVFSDYQ